MSNKVAEINQESELNIDRREHNMTQYTLYGDFEYVPIQKDRQRKIQDAFNEIDKIVKPTFSQLRQQDTKGELQDKIYQQFQYYQGQLNTCIMKARNVRDSNVCSDIFVDQILGKGRQQVIDILKQY